MYRHTDGDETMVIDRHIVEAQARRQQARMSPTTASAASHHTVTLLLVMELLLLLLPVFIVMVLAPLSRSLTAFTGTYKRHTRSRVSCYDAIPSGAVTPELYEGGSTAASPFCIRSALFEPR